MEKINLTARDIFDKSFNTDFKGYSANEVDSYLDLILEDYQAYDANIEELNDYIASLKEENEKLKENIAEIFSKPMNLGDFITEPCIFEKISDNEAYLTIHEGKFHQVKRMFQYAGSEVETLIRTDFAFLNLNGLDTGEYRHLTEEEITKLKELTDEKR